MCLEISIVRVISLSRIRAKSHHNSQNNGNDNNQIDGVGWMESFQY